MPHSRAQSIATTPRARWPVARFADPKLEEAEEALVVDPRGGLTPSQMVDQKLVALLLAVNPGAFLQTANWRQDLRRASVRRQYFVQGGR